MTNVRGECLDADSATNTCQLSLDVPQLVSCFVNEANVLGPKVGDTTCDLGSDRAGSTSDEHPAPPKKLSLAVTLGTERNPAEQLV